MASTIAMENIISTDNTNIAAATFKAKRIMKKLLKNCVGCKALAAKKAQITQTLKKWTKR